MHFFPIRYGLAIRFIRRYKNYVYIQGVSSFGILWKRGRSILILLHFFCLREQFKFKLRKKSPSRPWFFRGGRGVPLILPHIAGNKKFKNKNSIYYNFGGFPCGHYSFWTNCKEQDPRPSRESVRKTWPWLTCSCRILSSKINFLKLFVKK